MEDRRRKARRGVALVVVLGVLVVLSFLAATFTTLSATERSISRNYLDHVRARLLAQSGVEHAVAHLRDILRRGFFPEDGPPLFCGAPVEFTGTMASGTYAPRGDRYLLRIADASGMIHVNDGLAYDPDHSVNRNLRRVLNALGAQPGVDLPDLGDRILEARPPGGYASKHDLFAALGTDRVRPFLTTHAWVDPAVAEPVPLSEAAIDCYPVSFERPSSPDGPIHRHGHQKNALGRPIRDPLRFDDGVYGLDSLHPQWIEIVARAPVNVNTAPREVLIALLTDLRGFFLDERTDSPLTPGYGWMDHRMTYDRRGNDGDEIGFLRLTASLDAPAIADAIIDARAFRSWAQFNTFADGLVPDIVPSQAEADVLKANFNPNLNLNELNPDRALHTLVDKTDLVVHSTEFCFTPMGYFEIESTGQVMPEVAESKLSAVVRLFDAHRETTQQQFYAGTFGDRKSDPETNNNRAIETGPEPDNGRAPAENGWSGYLALPTIGGNLYKRGDRKPKGELWTTFPEEDVYPGATPMPYGGPHLGSSIHAHYQLDFVAHHHRDVYGGPCEFVLPMGPRWLVAGDRASVALNWEDRTERAPSPYGPVDGDRHRLGRAFTVPAEGFRYAPSDLRIDGIYCERHSAVGYWITEDSSWNFNAGTVAFWVKPAFRPELSGKPRALLSMSRYHNHNPRRMNFSPFTLYFLPAGGRTGFPASSLGFGVGMRPSTGYNWELAGENGGAPASLHAKVVTPSLAGGPLRAHEWTHVVVQWFLMPLRRHNEESVRILINGRALPGTKGLPSYYGS
ncbi:MAG: hypothetical protein ACYTAF_13915, partial [Planctomycetota bacterium]